MLLVGCMVGQLLHSWTAALDPPTNTPSLVQVFLPSKHPTNVQTHHRTPLSWSSLGDFSDAILRVRPGDSF